MVLNTVSLIIAIALVVVTYLYMRHTKRLANDTKRMADIMSQEFELKIAPIIQIEKRDGHFQGNFGSINYEIINKGLEPVHIREIVLLWWYKEMPSENGKKEVKIDGVMAAGELKKFTIQLSKRDFVGNNSAGKDKNLFSLRGLITGKMYAIWIDRNGNEFKTRDFLLESPF